MSPLDPLENGAEIEELLKFHCQLFAKVSGIFLRSCFAASKSQRACKQARERGWKEGWRGTDSERAGPGGEQGRDLGGGEGVGRKGPGTRSKDQEPSIESQEPGARSRGWRCRGRTLGLAAAEARRAVWRRRSGARGWSCAHPGRRAGQPAEGLRSGPRKNRLRGRGHAVLSLLPPRVPALLPGPEAEGGRGREGAVGKGDVQALDATALARSREGPRRAQGAQNSQSGDE